MKIFFFTMGSIYLAYLLYLVVQAYTELRSMPYFGKSFIYASKSSASLHPNHCNNVASWSFALFRCSAEVHDVTDANCSDAKCGHHGDAVWNLCPRRQLCSRPVDDVWKLGRVYVFLWVAQLLSLHNGVCVLTTTKCFSRWGNVQHCDMKLCSVMNTGYNCHSREKFVALCYKFLETPLSKLVLHNFCNVEK